MHVKTKKMSFLGLLLALAIILQLFGSIIEISTLSFLAASSFCLGIAIFEAGLTIGGGFLVASLALSFLFSPNKFYCLTYGALCLYIYFVEIVRKKTPLKQHPIILWIIKLVFYNGAFLFPILYFFPKLLFTIEISWNIWIYVGIVAAAQVVLVLFDWIYQKVVPDYWITLKRQLRLDF